MKFVLHASINWVKTPELLNLWGYTNSSACCLCQAEKCTLHHILSNCPVALTSKRYTWRHDSVLLHIQKALEILITDSNSKKETPTPHISQCFVKAGSKITKSSKKPKLVASALKRASDWKLLVDFDHDQVVFPPEILSTNERPDIVIWSIKLQKVILIELTCCAEEGMSSAQLRK